MTLIILIWRNILKNEIIKKIAFNVIIVIIVIILILLVLLFTLLFDDMFAKITKISVLENSPHSIYSK